MRTGAASGPPAGTAARPLGASAEPRRRLGPAPRLSAPSPRPSAPPFAPRCRRGRAGGAQRSAAQRGGCGLRRSFRAAAEQGEPPRGQHGGRAGRARTFVPLPQRFPRGPAAASLPRRRAERPGPRARQLSARSRPAPPRPRLASPRGRRPAEGPPPPPRALRVILVPPEPRCGSRPGRRCGTGGARGAGAAGFVLRGRTCGCRAGRASRGLASPSARWPGAAAEGERLRGETWQAAPGAVGSCSLGAVLR